MQCNTKQCQMKATHAKQFNVKKVNPSVCNAAQTWCGLLTTIGKEGTESWMSEKAKENLCLRLRRRFWAGEMVGRRVWSKKWKDSWPTQPKPCFTRETLEHAELSSSSLSSRVLSSHRYPVSCVSIIIKHILKIKYKMRPTQPKPCFTWETLEHAALSSSSLSSPRFNLIGTLCHHRNNFDNQI